MTNSKALICERCGAPMKTRRECDYCGTVYYTGPELPERVIVEREGALLTGSSGAIVLSVTSVVPMGGGFITNHLA